MLALWNRPPACPVFFQRGVNFTAENGYDPQPALPILDQLKRDGVNAIALVPYGFSKADQPAIHYPGGMERSDHIEALTALASLLDSGLADSARVGSPEPWRHQLRALFIRVDAPLGN